MIFLCFLIDYILYYIQLIDDQLTKMLMLPTNRNVKQKIMKDIEGQGRLLKGTASMITVV